MCVGAFLVFLSLPAACPVVVCWSRLCRLSGLVGCRLLACRARRLPFPSRFGALGAVLLGPRAFARGPEQHALLGDETDDRSVDCVGRGLVAFKYGAD